MFRLRGCTRCSGDLYKEEDHWRCLQCARNYWLNNPFDFAVLQETIWANAPGTARKRRGTKASSDASGLATATYNS